MSENVIDTPAASTDTGASPAAATPAASAAPTATPQATPQAPATGAPGEGWVPSYRVRETREAAMREAQQSFAAREAEYQARLQQVQSQLQALVGVTPPQNPEVEQIRSQFSQLYPGLSKIEQRAQDILGVLERSGDFEAQQNHYWQSYGRQTMDRLFEHAAESLGGPLSDDAKRHLHTSFVGYVSASPENQARYASDPSIVQDFWKAFTSNFIDPVRRSAGATTVARATGPALPQDTPGGVPRATPAPSLNGMDERAAAAWALYQQSKK